MRHWKTHRNFGRRAPNEFSRFHGTYPWEERQYLPMEITYALSPKDAAKSLGISRATLYRQISNGRIRVVKIGSRTVIPASCLLALLDEPAVNAEVVA